MIVNRRRGLGDAWGAAQPFLQSAAACLPGASGAVPSLCNSEFGTLTNPHVFRQAEAELLALGDVTYYRGRDGGLYPTTNLVMPGIEGVQGNLKYWPRYLDSHDLNDLNFRSGMPQQTAPGASTFTGRIIALTESQPRAPIARTPEPGVKPPPETVSSSYFLQPGVGPSSTYVDTDSSTEEAGGLPWLWIAAAGGALLLFAGGRGRG